MNDYKIKALFPKPLMIVDSVCLDQLPLFENTIRDIIQTSGSVATGYQNVESTHSTNHNLYELPEFAPLVTAIQDCAYEFLINLGYPREAISMMRMRNLWANTSTQGSYLFPHIHSNSIISGAYYIKSSMTDFIQFYNDVTETIPGPSTPTDINSRIAEEKCHPGRLILFKSNFLHGTTVKKDIEEKISMSFNIGF